jgi:hypothetical protein
MINRISDSLRETHERRLAEPPVSEPSKAHSP